MTELPGRNDPCPCGSGLKYKKCHEASDRAAAGAPHLRLLAHAPAAERDAKLRLPEPSQLSRAWELDIVPVPATFADNAAARPAAVLVVASGRVLGCEIVDRPSAEPDELASLLVRHVLAASERAGVAPTRVSIRHLELEEPMQPLLAAHGVAVAVADELPGLEDALRSLLGHLFSGIAPLHLLRSQPETWAGWGMPAERTARLFRAAAAFHRAAPWTVPARETPIVVVRPGGDLWVAVVLGAAGDTMGLTLYHDFDDLAQMFGEDSDDDPAAAFEGMEDLVVSLLFNTRAELPRRMRAEIKDHGWEVAGPTAYPTLTVLNAPGGGLRERYFEDVIAALESVPRFVAEHAEVLAGRQPAEDHCVWRDPESGTTCSLLPTWEPYAEFASPGVLQPAGPTGLGATPLAALDEQTARGSVNRTLARFRAWLRKPRRGKPPLDATLRRHAEIARLFVELCAYTSGIPITAVSEFQLRTFLYDWYPRKVHGTKADAQRMMVALRRFFEFLEDREGVRCPWAWPVLGDVEFFEARWADFPGGFFWDAAVQEWQGPYVRDLTRRVLIPVSDPHGGIEWGPTMGMVEYALNREAQRRWIAWRDEAVHGGITAPGPVQEFVMERQRAWAQAPNVLCEGLTPAAAIARERAQRSSEDAPPPPPGR
jgi:hypothetical protein